MKEYHKIQTVYLRDPITRHKTLLKGQFSTPEFDYLKDNKWIFTEKVDGTNIRIHWTCGHYKKVSGRTDNVQIPSFLCSKLEELFPVDKFFNLYPDISMTLYGEGYGAKIQKGGGNYIPTGCSFILFDVLVNRNWLNRIDVEDIAEKMDIKSVPVVGFGTLWDGIVMVRDGFKSYLRDTPPEGIVMRPNVELISRMGKRIITKIKTKDFLNSERHKND